MDTNQDYNFMPDDHQNCEKNTSAKQIAEETRWSHLDEAQKKNIEMFWDEQLLEVQNTTTISKSQHQFPLARIRKIMKSEGNVKMISSDTPILFSKACELFIMELTLRTWLQTEESKRRTIHQCDIAKAVRSNELLDFLKTVVPFGHDCYKDNVYAGKKSEGNVSSSVEMESTNLPMINYLSNTDMINSMIRDVPQQFIFDPSIMSSAEFHSYLPSK